MQRTNPTAARRRAVTPALALAMLAALIASLMAPATADVKAEANTSITTAPASVAAGAALGDIVATVSGTLRLDIAADLPSDLKTPQADLALFTDVGGERGDPVADGFAPAPGTATMGASGTFTFAGLRIADDLAPGSYHLQVTVSLAGVFSDTATKPLTVLPGYDESADCSATDTATDGCVIQFTTDTVNYTIEAPPVPGASVGVNIDTKNQAFEDECNRLEGVYPDLRLLSTPIQVVPSGFGSGDEVSVTIVIPKDVINEDVNRSDKPWTICFLDEKPADGDSQAHPDKGTVRLLDRCETTTDPACLVSLEKFKGANIELVFKFPAVDPFFR